MTHELAPRPTCLDCVVFRMNLSRLYSSRARILALLGLLALALVLWKPLGHHLEQKRALNSEFLDETAFSELISKSRDPFMLLSEAWGSGKIPHREAVIRFLKENPNLRLGMPGTEAILLSAARDGDANVRELALAALSARKHQSLAVLLADQMRDPDPNLRIFALDYLRSQPTNVALPIICAALDDRDLTVAASAAVAVQRLSGENFGIRVAQVLKSDFDETALEHFEEKLAAAKKWWVEHRQSFAPSPAYELPPVGPRFAVSNFYLQDLEGKAVRLSDFRGKAVFLNFWATWCTACQSEFPILNELQKRHPSNLVILGISLDGVADEHGHVPGHEESADPAGIRHTIQKEVSRVVQARGLGYKVLLDPENSVGSRFNGGELPTNVLIDSDGRFVRRFIGPRKIEVLEAMVSEAMIQ